MSVSFYRRQIYAYTGWHQLAVSTISGPAPFHPSRPVRDSTVGKRENDSPENQSINQPINQTNNQSINQPIKRTSNQSTNQPTNQTTNRPTNQPIKQFEFWYQYIGFLVIQLPSFNGLQMTPTQYTPCSSHPRNLIRKRPTKNHCIKSHQIMAP